MTESSSGAKKWFFPDGYLPEPDDSPIAPSHETVSIMNPSESKATVEVTVFFEDREPIEDVELEVEGRRDVHVRLDRFQEYSGVAIPKETPYGLELVSDVKVVCQLSRMDTRDDNLSLFTTTGYWEE